jgi:ribonuclease BN (tRNA processing enzyme)
MHVTDLVIHAHKFHNEAILLIHFSPRYKKQVRAACSATPTTDAAVCTHW